MLAPSWGQYIMKKEDLQALAAEELFLPEQALRDVDSRGKDRDWRARKMRNELLAQAYRDIDPQKAARLLACGKCLTYRVYPNGERRLDSMESCRVRLCPICTWRRSLKVFAQTRQIVDKIGQDYGYRWVMLTLTCKTCSGQELSHTLDMLLEGWNRLLQLQDVRRVCKGWYRSLEVVHDVNPHITREMWYGDPQKHIRARGKWYRAHGYKIGDENPNYDMYHPHIHALIAVNPSYFTSRDYIKQALWADLWGQSMRVDYTPRVDIRTVKGETMEEISSAVCEVSKYAAKDADYIVPDDWDLTVDTVRILDAALHNRRLIAYGGIMRVIKRQLKLDDVEDGNLVRVGDEEQEPDGTYKLVSYWWYSGYRQYYCDIDSV